MLSEADPALELPEDQRWAAGLYGKVRDHSAALREGICETLVILSVHGNNLFRDRLGIDVEDHVSQLIYGLLTPLTLDKLLSHDNDLPRYAEAAPDEFLKLLEADLQRIPASRFWPAKARQQWSVRWMPANGTLVGSRVPGLAAPRAREPETRAVVEHRYRRQLGQQADC